jgi:hypothetical protein
MRHAVKSTFAFRGVREYMHNSSTKTFKVQETQVFPGGTQVATVLELQANMGVCLFSFHIMNHLFRGCNIHEN